MWRLSACAVAAILTSVASVHADTVPTTGQGESPRAAVPAAPVTPTATVTATPMTSSPYWNSAPATDLPAADIRNVTTARAESVRTYWTYQQTQTDLNNAIRVARMQMDRDPKYVKALAEEKSTYDALEAARGKALADLNNSAAYVGAEELRKNVSDQIADEQAKAKPDPSRLMAMAKLKVQYSRDNRKLEADALQRDEAYQDARKQYMAAAQRVHEFNDAQALAVATDDALISLRRAVASARIEKTTSYAYYDSAIVARNIAVDYAYDYRSIDRYHGYGNGYAGYGGYGGYGYGGGYGFGGYGGYGGRTGVR